MSNYLSQIASRSVSSETGNAPGLALNPAPAQPFWGNKQGMEAVEPTDPFEAVVWPDTQPTQTAGDQLMDEGTPLATKSVPTSRLKAETPSAYLTRHIARTNTAETWVNPFLPPQSESARRQETTAVPFSTQSNPFESARPTAVEPVKRTSPTVQETEKGQNAASPQSTTDQPQEIKPVLLNPEPETPSVVPPLAVTYPKLDVASVLMPNAPIPPAVAPSKPASQPKLVIGKINVEIVKSAPSIQTIQRPAQTSRQEAPANPAPTTVSSHLIFGLGQL